ncbi:MAG: outer membrane protein assembly factor BamA [Acidobacteria bacterium]|nr:outer membrane protein assembly factor BamA [Acidobacteriota bacterium]
MRHPLTRIVASLVVLYGLLVAFPAGAADSEGPALAKIIVEGGVTLTEDTVSYYLGLEPGDPVNQEELDVGFHRLWDSGLFEDLRIEEETLPDGRVNLYVIVKERPFVRTVEFQGNKKLNDSKLRDKLDERGVELPRNVPLKLGDLARIQSALKDIYTEEGYRAAQIAYTIEDISKKEKKVIFHIAEGGKIKIDEIDFEGNEAFSDGKLRGSLKKLSQASWYKFWTGKKAVFSQEAWEAAKDNLKKFYLNHGYKDVKIGKPRLKMEAKHPEAETPKAKKYRLTLIIPVEEGEQYTLGELKIKGATVFPADKLKMAFHVRPGKIYSFKEIDKGMEAVRNLYQNRGYIYAYTNQVLENHPGVRRVVDVTIDIFEGDRFHLNRLEFKGNTTTRDKVIRRQFRVNEQDFMAMGVFKSSVYRVNALGFWKLDDDPLEFNFDNEKKLVDVNVKGHEVGRNDLQFGAGYSELDGFFVQGMFNTRNFLGKGESLGLSVQLGGRANYYSLSFTDPYFLDRRMVVGASIYNNDLNIADFERRTRGFSLTFGFGLGAWDSFSVLYGYDDVKSRYATTGFGGPGDLTGGHVPPIGVPPTTTQPLEFAHEVFTGRTSALTPVYSYDSRDDPFDTNRGRRFVARLRLAGGLLGGDFDYVRPELQYTQWHPFSKVIIGAFNVSGGQFFPYSGSDIPIYERYRLGGDRSLRGIPYYTVVPRTGDGKYFTTPGGSILGGDRYWQTNFELQFRVGGPVKLVYFIDLGNTYFDTQGWKLSQFRRTTGLELRILLPIFQAPLRFIYGINLDPYPDESRTDFQFSIGTTF